MEKRMKDSVFLIFVFVLLSRSGFCKAADTINTTDIVGNGDKLVSADYELGFFSPGNNTNLYLGIWYRTMTTGTTPIWVANRESPLTNTTSGVLKFTQSGQLILQDANNNTLWSSNTTRVARNPVAQLLDSGNLVIHEANDDRPENYLWQSFDDPTNTLVHGREFGWNLVTGIERYLSSWKSKEDPAPGPFTLHMDISGYPQMVIKRGNTVLYRLGPYTGTRFSGNPFVRRDPTFRSELVVNSSVVYYREDNIGSLWMFSLNEAGVGQRSRWVNQSQEWSVYYNLPGDICDTYKLCGSHGNCRIGMSPTCGCLDRFVPKDEEDWSRSDWSGGCVRRTPLKCESDVFLSYSGIKMPDSRRTWFNESTSIEECKDVCLRNCSCMAHSNLDERNGGSGCLLWFGDLDDIRLIPGEAEEIYIRMAASELQHSNDKKATILIAILTSLGGVVLLGLIPMLFIIWKRKRNTQKLREQGDDEDLELPTLGLLTIRKATNDFSINNKLGEGGYGPVYKGKLEDGTEVAVKRLSRTSTQGLDEFKNEVICIAKLQHRNLVKLLGCCIEGEEKMLIYEYMPNNSLDKFLFDQSKSKQLDWPRRFQIINSIARGLSYLHQDSRLRIIHRDLKASNILLDVDMNPKISDFGMARSFGGNETEASTRRIVGTYGYMSPEYAGDGLFSVKSDAYSFGVLMLELVTGQQNRRFQHNDHHHNLLGHAWILHKQGKSLDLVDANLVNSINTSELLRCIHVALLCVQQIPEDRPNMSSVILMLGSESILPQPNQPGFFTERNFPGPISETSTNGTLSTLSMNACSTSLVTGR